MCSMENIFKTAQGIGASVQVDENEVSISIPTETPLKQVMELGLVIGSAEADGSSTLYFSPKDIVECENFLTLKGKY